MRVEDLCFEFDKGAGEHSSDSLLDSLVWMALCSFVRPENQGAPIRLHAGGLSEPI